MPGRLKLGLLCCCANACMASNVYASEPLATIKGDLPEDVRILLNEVLGEVETPARSLAQARRRAVKAGESALSVMRSQGYYGADIDVRVTETPASADATTRLPPQPTLTITPGPRFTVSSLDVVYTDAAPDIAQETFNKITLAPNAPALAAKVVAAELQAVNYLNAHGFPDAKAGERKAVVDHAAKKMAITYNITVGQRTRFGEIEQTGTAYLAKSWPKMISPFKPGDEFDTRKLNLLASRVIGTGVFDGAVATLSDDSIPNGDGSVTRNVLLNVEQGAINTVSGEVGFSTSDGSGLDLTYERRNFIGYAQTLTLSSSLKTNQISFGTDYNIPFAWRQDRELDLGAELAREDTDAFKGDRVGGNILLTQKISKNFKVGLGFGLEASKFEENGEDVTAYLIDGLGRATYDSRNSLFDPKKGYFAEAALIPSYNFGEEDGLFTTATLGASTYRRVSDKIVLAGRAKLGTIVGGSLETIPLNRRFYAGGGGSVRGFGYQTISPVNAQGEPIGGRSVSEVSAELRYKGESPIGFAAFVDAGSVTQKENPDFDDIRAGAGVGVRYFTSFAPMRADIAIPLNKRDGDNSFQIYISIGQAF